MLGNRASEANVGWGDTNGEAGALHAKEELGDDEGCMAYIYICVYIYYTLC